MPERDPRPLFHLVPRPAWRALLASGASEWRPASLAREGFVHLSFADQLEGTLRVHFAGFDEVALLELDRARLPLAPALEPSRDGELFPHLYAPLPLAAVARTHALRRDAAGELRPPPELRP